MTGLFVGLLDDEEDEAGVSAGVEDAESAGFVSALSTLGGVATSLAASEAVDADDDDAHEDDEVGTEAVEVAVGAGRMEPAALERGEMLFRLPSLDGVLWMLLIPSSE